MWRLPRFLNALEAWILERMESREAADAWLADLYAPPLVLTRPRAAPRPAGMGRPPQPSKRPRRRAMTLEQAKATTAADEAFQREMSRGGR